MHTNPSLRLAELFDAGRTELIARYGSRLRAHHRRAMHAIMACRSGTLGQVDWQCPDCAEHRHTPRSCGHRSCPQCQNHSTTGWLERQRDKLLPVDYFMVTFTLPAGLRPLAQAQPQAVYAALFSAAAQTIKGFGQRKLKAELGQCAVLHTHNRRLDLLLSSLRSLSSSGPRHSLGRSHAQRPVVAKRAFEPTCAYCRARRRHRRQAKTMAQDQRPLSV